MHGRHGTLNFTERANGQRFERVVVKDFKLLHAEHRAFQFEIAIPGDRTLSRSAGVTPDSAGLAIEDWRRVQALYTPTRGEG